MPMLNLRRRDVFSLIDTGSTGVLGTEALGALVPLILANPWSDSLDSSYSSEEGLLVLK